MASPLSSAAESLFQNINNEPNSTTPSRYCFCIKRRQRHLTVNQCQERTDEREKRRGRVRRVKPMRIPTKITTNQQTAATGVARQVRLRVWELRQSKVTWK